MVGGLFSMNLFQVNEYLELARVSLGNLSSEELAKRYLEFSNDCSSMLDNGCCCEYMIYFCRFLDSVLVREMSERFIREHDSLSGK